VGYGEGMTTKNPFLANPTPENLERERQFEIEFLGNLHNWNEVFSKPYLSYREVILWAVFRSWSDVASHRWLSNSVPGGAENFIKALFNRLPQLIDQVQQSLVTIHLNPQSAHGRLMGALRAVEVHTTGLRTGELERRAILADQWDDLQITDFPGASLTAPDDRACLDGVPVWSRLKFKRSDIERLFPPIDADEKAIAEAVESEVAAVAVVEKLSAANIATFKKLHKDGAEAGKFVTLMNAEAWGNARGLSIHRIWEWRREIPSKHKLQRGGSKPNAT